VIAKLDCYTTLNIFQASTIQVSTLCYSTFWPLYSNSVLMAIFPGEPGLAGFIRAKDDKIGGENGSYKDSQPSLPTN